MLHQCKSCSTIYLVSDFYDLCNHCGQERQRMIWQLSAPDDAVEWWRQAMRMAHGEPRGEPKRRWEIR